jgi:Zn-dependent protease
VLAFVHVLLSSKGVISPGSDMNKVLYFATTTNFVLFFFNLLPLPPLDGGHVAQSFTPYRHRKAFEDFARFGPFVVMAVAMIPQLAQIFTIPAGFCAHGLYQLMGVY